MSNYQTKESYIVNKFKLSVYPYVAAPDNVFTSGAALQYGADFKVRFRRGGVHQNKIGLIQLILPRTKLFSSTVVGTWNVDKRVKNPSPITLAQSLYSDDNGKIGSHSEHYQGKSTRNQLPGECWLIDTPRELNNQFNQGVFNGVTSTKFANYVVELSGQFGTLFNQGIVWGYSVVQQSSDLTKFEINVQEPRECFLDKHNEHLSAIEKFLSLNRGKLISCINKH